MYIILLGANPLVMALAHALGKRGHSITCIARDETYLNKLQQRLDCRIICGSPSYPEVLREAEAERADLLIAATLNDEMNMIACQVAFSLFNIPKKIACISSAHYLIRHDLFGDENLPIDLFINPERLITEHIAHLIEHPGATLMAALEGGLCMDVLIEEGADAVGKPIHDLTQNTSLFPIKVLALYRNDETLEAKHESVLQANDRLIVIGPSRSLKTTLEMCHKNTKAHKRLLIASDDGVGEELAQRLSTHYQVKILNDNLERCQVLAKTLKHCIVLHGNLNDEDLMKEENIDKVDVFCAVTQDDEDNILAAIQAKHLGAKQTLLLMKHKSYVPLLKHNDIDIIIPPHQLILDKILANCTHPWIEHYQHLTPFGHIIALNLPQTTQQWTIAPWQALPNCQLAAVIRDKNWLDLKTLETLEGKDTLVYFIDQTSDLKTLTRRLDQQAKKVANDG